MPLGSKIPSRPMRSRTGSADMQDRLKLVSENLIKHPDHPIPVGMADFVGRDGAQLHQVILDGIFSRAGLQAGSNLAQIHSELAAHG